MNRRRFLKQTTVAIGTAMAYRHLPSAWARPARVNGDIRVAIIGLGNKGRQHVTAYANMPGVRLAALCDVDPRHLAAAAPLLPPGGAAIVTTTDARRIIDRGDIDAVVIATPDHWHALLGVWACQAGKDVYVEKPVAHNVWEGRQLIEAARKHGRIMQAGTQFRSDVGLREAAAWLREGHLGRPRWGHVVWYEYRQSIGRTAPYRPDWLDYDLYCGPAPLEPLTRTNLHYDWHWVWNTGTGDLCNSGIHAFDVCRWFAGLNGLPNRVMSVGGRFVWDDAGQTPNTQLTLLDYPDIPILIENRNLPSRSGLKAMDVFHGIREGFALYFERGYFLGLRGGGWIYDQNNQRVRQFQGDGGGQHTANFIDAVRSRRTTDLHAPIEEGFVSTAACLFGNVSWRLGAPAPARVCREAIGAQPGAAETLAGLEQNLGANGVNVTQTPMTLGPWLEVATDGVRNVAGGGEAALAAAQKLVRPPHRKPFEFPSET